MKNYELRITNYELRVTNYELLVNLYQGRTSYELKNKVFHYTNTIRRVMQLPCSS
jgi:hypothetical protein